jgi:polyadenylate-binding protein
MYSKIRNRGLAFVTMGSPEEAVAALNNLESYVNTLSSILSFFGI